VTGKPPVVDGRLDDACWQDVQPIGPLRQMAPLIDAEATEATEVRLLRDASCLYIGVRCRDREPDQIVATQMGRDADLDFDDRIEIVVDTFHDRRNAFYFRLGPAGSKGDALVARDGQSFNLAWDGIWEGHTAIDADGWTAEVAIPFQTLAFDPRNDTWGFNVARTIKRRLETDRCRV